MTITSRIHKELFVASASPVPPTATASPAGAPVRLIRIPLTNPRVENSPHAAKNKRRRLRRQRERGRKSKKEPKGLAWTADEHERFLRGLELFPRGPWKEVADFVATRSVRQTMTHAQKYRQKIARHQRGLHPSSAKKMMTIAASAKAQAGLAAPVTASSGNATACQSPSTRSDEAAAKSPTADFPAVNSPGAVSGFPFCTHSTTESWEHVSAPIAAEADNLANSMESLDSLLDDTLLDDLMADEAIDALIDQCLTEVPLSAPIFTVASWGFSDTQLTYECAL